ncbi:MAG: YitT family protein [Clostridiales bacterium]|nr:YitT family protein [Clostridiales bacterium]
MKQKRLLTRENLIAWGQIVLGCLIGALAYPWFLVPNHIAPGGLTGLATVLNYLFGWPVGTTSLLMNIPLFLIGFKSMGGGFAIRSLTATLLFSLFIDLLPLGCLTQDPMLASVFGGALLGIGLGLILRAGATTGGTDMAARMVHKFMPYLTVGMILFVIDGIVVVLAGIYIHIEHALYAFISIYVSSMLINLMVDGLTTEKACYIIASAYEQIKAELMAELNRGVTVLDARGGFSGEERPVLLCVVSAQEVARLKLIVRRIDDKAFVFISDAHEVLGEGFRQLTEE